MDSCQAVEKELERILGKFVTYQENASQSLDDLIASLESMKEKYDNNECEMTSDNDMDCDDGSISDMKSCLKEVRDKISKVGSDHKELHSMVSKVGKAIDKNFTSDFACVNNEKVFGGSKKEIVNSIICHHLHRDGLIDVASTLQKEGKFDSNDNYPSHFIELNKIVESLKNGNLDPAFEWAKTNREKLKAIESNLEFQLHRLAYIKIVRDNPQHLDVAIKYARENFPSYGTNHLSDLQTLLGCLVYAKEGLDKSPYSHFLSPHHWVEISHMFIKDACAALGLSVNSPLAVCLNAGCAALPILLNIRQALEQQKVHTVWDGGKEELPIEIDLGTESHYHSIFACPILRQISTQANPPMRLICGHVISKDAVAKLANSNKFKCPYCPMEQSMDDTTFIYF